MAKTELFDEPLQQAAAYFKVLSHPARLAIINYLIESGTCITGDITEELPLSRTTVSQHLQELKDCNLIQGTVNGAKVNYCINSIGLEDIISELRNMAAKLEKSKSCKC
ncbi:MAG: metalloregulator ArsR/SmtB family transcription factor [Bacteroidales bacterium]|nr:metalloregulator ArsR/SmtB family transcription factor [Bacteroidales bacterium]